jgi:hypothetical protein
VTDLQATALSGAAGLVAKSTGLIKGVVIGTVVIEGHGLLSTLATGGVAAIGGLIVNESYKRIKDWYLNRKTKK